MKGQNEIELNEATVIEAMQEYFDRRFTISQFKVTAVRGNSSVPAQFKITTVEHPKKEVKA